MAAPTENIRYVKGIGEQRAKALEKLGIKDLFSLISYFPRTYEDRRTVSEIGSLRLGESACVKAIVSEPPRVAHIRRGLDIVKLRVFDGSGSLSLTFFNQSYVRDQLKTGEEYWFFGRVGGSLLQPEMTNPVFERENAPNRVTGRIVPVYRLTAGITQNLLMRSIAAGLAACAEDLSDPLPSTVREKYSLPFARYAYEKIHFPTSPEDLEPARRRFVFEELFILTCALSMFRERRVKTGGIKTGETDLSPFYSSLPYTLTSAQIRSINEAVSDMTSGRVMSRLLQGDVGSGKTAVAAACAWHVFKSGLQTAFMAPTEILAAQHYENALRTLEPSGVRCRLLTGSTKAKDRKKILEELKKHQCDAVFGTHALISSDVEYGRLGLVITDEQHRFGVNQRSSLQLKGKVCDAVPHVLVMSATPIPRTLALILYGDLDLSVIDELPKGRMPVRTRLVPESKRNDMYGFLRDEVRNGRQAYIVCPLVEEDNDQQEIRSAKALFESLGKNELNGLRLGLTWGSQKAEEKDRVLHEFADGHFDVLVSITVIEVGVNNPNATIMIIENAERYGLSQLHQLRGRVGRGSAESWCFLFAEPSEKLRLFCSTNDGFIIAQKDLELRGPGDLTGTRQSGEAGAGFLYSDIRLLDEVTQCVQKLHRDPSQKEELRLIEQYAVGFFSSEGHTIALN